MRALALNGWLVGIVIVVVLLPVAPPTAALPGAAGWAVGAGIQLVSLVGWLVFRGAGERAGRHAIAVVTWALPVDLALMQWLAGGPDAPYGELLPLALILGSVALQGVVVGAFCVLVATTWLAPFAYAATVAGLDRALAALAVWLFVALALARLMNRIRGQARLARIDALTGLANRRAFDEAEFDGVASVALVIGDVDHFKTINDRFGHLEGDACLRNVATMLAATVRNGDQVFRWGGDEFAVLLCEATPERAAVTAVRLEEAVPNGVFDLTGNPVRVSFGWAIGRPGEDVRDLVDAADIALLERKRARPGPASSPVV